MSVKTKAALTTLSLNVLLTALKFLLFFFSGSLAVLAEAWHSFSDIATSFLVLLAVHREEKGGAEKAAPAGGEQAPDKGKISLEQAARQVRNLLPDPFTEEQMDAYLDQSFVTYPGVPELIQWSGLRRYGQDFRNRCCYFSMLRSRLLSPLYLKPDWPPHCHLLLHHTKPLSFLRALWL